MKAKLTAPIFVATTFHDREPSRVHGPFSTEDAACDWLMNTLGPTDAGVVHEVRPVGGKPALTAEAWMLLRMLVARARQPVFNSPKFTDDLTRVVVHLNRTYGHQEVLTAIDTLDQEYASAANPR